MGRRILAKDSAEYWSVRRTKSPGDFSHIQMTCNPSQKSLTGDKDMECLSED